MHEVVLPVSEFLFADCAVLPDEEPLLPRQQRVFEQRLIQPVNIALAVLQHVDISEPRRRTLHREQRIKDERILSMCVEPRLFIFWQVFRGKNQLILHESAVVQHRVTVMQPLIVPIHHYRLAAGLHHVVEHVAAHVQSRCASVQLQPRIPFLQHLSILQHGIEHVAAVLQIDNAGLPEKLQQVNAFQRNIAQPARRGGVPEHARRPRARLELIPPQIGVQPLHSALLQYDRQHLAQHPSRVRVALFSRQHDRLRLIIHCVRVLIQNGIEQPRAHRLHLILRSASPHLPPMPQFPPLFIRHDPIFQRPFPVLILLQRLCGSPHLIQTDHK